jgi:hypothetical protein
VTFASNKQHILMYHYSRAIFRALKDMVEPQTDSVTPGEARRQVLEACERTVERIAEDPRYFARPARSLFEEIRFYFPITQQARVYFVIDRAIGLALTSVRAEQARRTEALNRCRAMTRKGAPCQRQPLPGTAHCPSHQHLAERPARVAATAAA